MIELVQDQEWKIEDIKVDEAYMAQANPALVAQFRAQHRAGQRLQPEVDPHGNLISGRHRLAALRAEGVTMVWVRAVCGSTEDIELRRLSSIVNQRAASGEEERDALVRMVALIEKTEAVTKDEAQEKAAQIAGKSKRTVQRQLREAKPEEEKKPGKKRKNRIILADGSEFNEAAAEPEPPHPDGADAPEHDDALRKAGEEPPGAEAINPDDFPADQADTLLLNAMSALKAVAVLEQKVAAALMRMGGRDKDVEYLLNDIAQGKEVQEDLEGIRKRLR